MTRVIVFFKVLLGLIILGAFGYGGVLCFLEIVFQAKKIDSALIQKYAVVGNGVLDQMQKTGRPCPLFNEDTNGKPLLSWRVHILPHIGQEELYNQFRLDEPWNSDHNQKLVYGIPDCFASKGNELGFTRILAVSDDGKTVGSVRALDMMSPYRFDANVHGKVLAIESATSVPWTKPVDVSDLEKSSFIQDRGFYVIIEKLGVLSVDNRR